MSRKHQEEEHENHERWAVSYADMMTVLLALFIVLYAISVVDKEKFEELRVSLAVGFGQDVTSMLVGSSGPLNGVESFQIAPDFTGVDGEANPQLTHTDIELSQETKDFLAAAREYEQLTDIQAQIEESLRSNGLEAAVQYKIDSRGLIVGMIGSDVFFAADDAQLTTTAQRVVDTMAVPVRNQSRQVSIEGHANVLPSSNYPTNWELSSARATQVLRRFVEAGGVPGNMIAAVGYGDARPAVQGDSDAALSENRRVDVVIQSSASENVRALLPQIAQSLADGSLTADQLHAEIEAAQARTISQEGGSS